jgi:hypothetical protein
MWVVISIIVTSIIFIWMGTTWTAVASCIIAPSEELLESVPLLEGEAPFRYARLFCLKRLF